MLHCPIQYRERSLVYRLCIRSENLQRSLQYNLRYELPSLRSGQLRLQGSPAPTNLRFYVTGSGRLKWGSFLSTTSWPHRWPYMVDHLRKVVALVKARVQTWPDF